MRAPFVAAACLSLVTLCALPGCKGAVKAGARVAREGSSGSSGAEGGASSRTSGNTIADEVAAERAREKEAEAHFAEAEALLKAFKARRPEALWLPETRVDEFLARDATLHPDVRLPGAGTAAMRILLSIPAIGRGERSRADALLRTARLTLESLPAPLAEALKGHTYDNSPAVGRLREATFLLLGEFRDAHSLAYKRYERDRYNGNVTPGDLADRLELGVLAKVRGSSWSEEEAFVGATPEVEAILRAYKALDYVWGRSRDLALEQLDLADAAAKKVTAPRWNFQTLGKPFTGSDPHERCGTRFYEAVRNASFPWTADNYLVGPLLGLRLCILAMPPDKR